MDKLILKNKQGIYAVTIDDIVYMEKKLRKINVYTLNRMIEVYGSFSDVLPFLDDRFMHCHRSYLINMDKIISMYRNEIYVTGNKTLFFGRDSFAKAKKIFMEYLQRELSEKH